MASGDSTLVMASGKSQLEIASKNHSALDGYPQSDRSPTVVPDAFLSKIDRFGLPIVLVVASFCFFFRLGSVGICDGSESYYPSAAREMIEAGNYLVPQLNYQLLFAKPIMIFWLIIAGYKMFGMTAFATRFFAAVVAVGLTGLTYFSARAVSNVRTAFLAAFIVMASPLVLDYARLSEIDLFFSSWLALSFLSTLLVVCAGRKKLWPLIYVGLGLALLTKGPASLVIYAVASAMALALQWKDLPIKFWPALKAIKPHFGLPLMLAIALPWWIHVWRATDGAFPTYFWAYENLGRANGHTNSNPMYWFKYPVVILVGLFPWSLLLPAFIWRTLKSVTGRGTKLADANGTTASGAAGSHAAGSHAAGSHAAGSHAAGSHAAGSHAAGSHASGSHATASNTTASSTSASGAATGTAYLPTGAIDAGAAMDYAPEAAEDGLLSGAGSTTLLDAKRWALGCGLAVISIFGASRTQMEPYLLPMMAPLAVYLALSFNDWLIALKDQGNDGAFVFKWNSFVSKTAFGVGLAFVIGGFVLPAVFKLSLSQLCWPIVALPLAGLLIGTAMTMQFLLVRNGQVQKGFIAMGLIYAIGMAVGVEAGIEAWYNNTTRDLHYLCTLLENKPGQVAFYADTRCSTLFYVKRPVYFFFQADRLVPYDQYKYKLSDEALHFPLYIFTERKHLPALTCVKGTTFITVGEKGKWGLYEVKGARLEPYETLINTFNNVSLKDLATKQLPTGPLTLPFGGGTYKHNALDPWQYR